MAVFGVDPERDIAGPESTIKNIFVRTAPELILGPSKLRPSEAPAHIIFQMMQYAPLNPLRCCPHAKLMVN